MAGRRRDGRADASEDGPRPAAIFQEGDVLLPGQAAMTQSPAVEAASSSQHGGGVYTRTALIPARTIAAKSSATCSWVPQLAGTRA